MKLIYAATRLAHMYVPDDYKYDICDQLFVIDEFGNSVETNYIQLFYSIVERG